MMTIQNTQVPIRTPSSIDLWPAATTHTVDDVVIASVRLTRLVAWCDTPSVHTGRAVIPGTGGQPSGVDPASVLVARVVAVEWRSDLVMHVVIDADLCGCSPFLAEARVIGRQATVHLSAAVMSHRYAEREAGFLLRLPSDVVVGDLVAVPCAGATFLHDVKLA